MIVSLQRRKTKFLANYTAASPVSHFKRRIYIEYEAILMKLWVVRIIFFI